MYGVSVESICQHAYFGSSVRVPVFSSNLQGSCCQVGVRLVQVNKFVTPPFLICQSFLPQLKYIPCFLFILKKLAFEVLRPGIQIPRHFPFKRLFPLPSDFTEFLQICADGSHTSLQMRSASWKMCSSRRTTVSPNKCTTTISHG